MTRAHGVAGIAVLSLTAFVYLYQLDRVPPYLGLDEAHFGVHGHALATTGRDLNGNQHPLFINLADPLGDQPALAWGNTWYQPVLFYLIAVVLKFAELSEFAVRLPTAVIGGIINVALMYAVTWRLVRHRGYAVIGALLLAASPAHVLLCRQAADYVCPLPFMLAWFWCLLVLMETGQLRFAFIAGLILGIGCYTYITSWLLMPFCLALSLLVIARSGPARLHQAALLVGGFLLPMALLVPWLWAHPEMLANLAAAYGRPDPGSVSVTQAIAQDTGAGAIARMVMANYWDYFNPSFLFVSGSPSRAMSTGQAGVFLWPVAVLLPLGLAALLRRDDVGWARVVMLACLFAAPLGAALKGSPFAIQRAVMMVPFVILISIYGVALLWESRQRAVRAALVVLLGAGALQFAGFYRDYLTGYPVRAAAASDPTAFREASDFLLAADRATAVPAILLTAPLYDVSAKWRFYTTMHGRTELLHRTRYFDGNLLALSGIESGSLAVVPVEEASIGRAREAGSWSVERELADISGRRTLTIVRKTAITPGAALTPRLQAQAAPTIVVDAPSVPLADQSRAAAAAREAAARYVAWLGPAPVPSFTITAAPWRGRPAEAAGQVAIRFPWWPAPESMDVESQVSYALALEWLRGLGADADTHTLARGIAWYLQSRVVEPLYDLSFHVPGHSADGFRLFGSAVPRTFHALPAGRWTLGLGRGEPTAAVRPADLDAPALRMAQTFGTLERYLGWPALQGALHALTARASSTTLTRQDAVDTLGAAAGQDLGWLFAAAFDPNRQFDYAVESMAATTPDRPCGFEPCVLSRVVVVRRGDGVFSGASRPATGPYESGDAVALRVEFADGQAALARWDGRRASRTFEFLAAAPVAIAQLDPDRVLLLDRDYLDNSRAAAPRPPPAMGKWIARWLIWLQDAMLAYTF